MILNSQLYDYFYLQPNCDIIRDNMCCSNSDFQFYFILGPAFFFLACHIIYVLETSCEGRSGEEKFETCYIDAEDQNKCCADLMVPITTCSYGWESQYVCVLLERVVGRVSPGICSAAANSSTFVGWGTECSPAADSQRFGEEKKGVCKCSPWQPTLS